MCVNFDEVRFNLIVMLILSDSYFYLKYYFYYMTLNLLNYFTFVNNPLSMTGTEKRKLSSSAIKNFNLSFRALQKRIVIKRNIFLRIHTL